ncbi:hypothetical protein EI555_002964, partial [Monodon monoceros]
GNLYSSTRSGRKRGPRVTVETSQSPDRPPTCRELETETQGRLSPSPFTQRQTGGHGNLTLETRS